MTTYTCPCGYVYSPLIGDPVGGISSNILWDGLPDGWVCPVCGASKDCFTPVETEEK